MPYTFNALPFLSLLGKGPGDGVIVRLLWPPLKGNRIKFLLTTENAEGAEGVEVNASKTRNDLMGISKQ